VAEISIPEPKIADNVASLETARFIQNFSDPLEGKRDSVNPGSRNPKQIGGLLVHQGKLIVSVNSVYDAGSKQDTSHFSRSKDLLASDTLFGPVKVGKTYPGWVGGYMSDIPRQWQAELGGQALTGKFGLAIIGLQSWGPTVTAFNPDFDSDDNADGKLLLGYPANQSILGGGYDVQSEFFNGSSKGSGIVIPNNSSSLLFFGRHGYGRFCYGTGKECGDPASANKGVHAYPYRYRIWAYDLRDLAAARNGRMKPNKIHPYGIWTLDLPFSTAKKSTGGAAYDRAKNRLFLSLLRSDKSRPLIQVFTVGNKNCD
jgi:hypothetical protein